MIKHYETYSTQIHLDEIIFKNLLDQTTPDHRTLSRRHVCKSNTSMVVGQLMLVLFHFISFILLWSQLWPSVGSEIFPVISAPGTRSSVTCVEMVGSTTVFQKRYPLYNCLPLRDSGSQGISVQMVHLGVSKNNGTPKS